MGTPNTSLFREAFDGHPITFVTFRGEPVVVARELGAALGYAGSSLGDLIRREWAADFKEGVDYRTLDGADLSAFKAEWSDTVSDAVSTSLDRTRRSLFLLTESGWWMVAQKTEKALGVKLRRFLAERVLPKLARGEAIGAAPERQAHDHLTARELRLLGDRYWRAGQRDKALELYDAAERAHGLPARKVSPPRPQPPQQLPLPTPRPVEVAVPAPTTILTVLAAIEDRAERDAATWLVSQWDAGQSPATRSFGDRFGFGYDRANRLRTWLAGEASRLGGRVPAARTKPPRTSTQTDPADDLRRTVTASPARMEIKSLVMAILDASGPDGARRSIPQLAAAAGMNERTARKHLAALVEAGAVVREDDREFKAPMWRVRPDELAAKLGAFAKDGRGGNRPGMRAVGDA